MAHTLTGFEALLRGLVKAVAGFEGKTIALIEEEFAAALGIAPPTFPHVYRGKVPLSVPAMKFLVETGAARAYLSRRWGERLLRAAQAPYGMADEWLDAIWPRAAPHATLPPRVLHNLPAPSYSAFVMRAAPYVAILDGLRQRSPVVAVVSLGGMGKTSLLREIAGRCLHQRAAPGEPMPPTFDAAVWIGDHDQPGLITLDVVLDTIATTLDYPGLTALEPSRKRHEVEHLVKGCRVLLVIDNLETVVDDMLLHWVLRLPEPSKALLASREYRRTFQHGVWLVDLGGMVETEAEQFLTTRIQQMHLQVPLAATTRQQIVAATGGNPKAIAILLGLTRRTGQVERALADDLLGDLFSASWAALDEAARGVLLALALFPTSAAAPTLSAVADLDETTLRQALAQLVDLALVEIAYGDTIPPGTGARYGLHPLTRQFVAAHLGQDPMYSNAACTRWLRWTVTYVAEHGGYRPDHIPQLQAALAPEEPLLYAALQWAVDHGRDADAIQIALGLEFYYYVRTAWGRKLALHTAHLQAARRLGDVAQEIYALALQTQLLSRQGHLQEAAETMSRLRHVGQRQPLHGWSFFHLWHTQGLYHLGAGALDSAMQAWRHLLEHDAEVELPPSTHVAIHHWLAVCRYRQGEHTAARALFETALQHARARASVRWVGRIQIALALIDLAQGQITDARTRLVEGRTTTDLSDAEQQARLFHAEAQLHAAEGDHVAASAAFENAIDLFERMGLVLELQAARTERDDLCNTARSLRQ